MLSIRAGIESKRRRFQLVLTGRALESTGNRERRIQFEQTSRVWQARATPVLPQALPEKKGVLNEILFMKELVH